jgi:[ribosomal protein S18]-alanine N-acetyltransferase
MPSSRASAVGQAVDGAMDSHDTSRFTVERVTDLADLDDVCRLEAASFSNPWTREMLEAELRRLDVARVYVLRHDSGELLAFCFCWILADELHINTIAVAAAYRRRGLARALMEGVLADAVRGGVRRATLEVRRSNEAARHLYRSLGFEERAIRRRYYTHPEEDALILWLDPIPGAGPGSP